MNIQDIQVMSHLNAIAAHSSGPAAMAPVADPLSPIADISEMDITGHILESSMGDVDEAANNPSMAASVGLDPANEISPLDKWLHEVPNEQTQSTLAISSQADKNLAISDPGGGVRRWIDFATSGPSQIVRPSAAAGYPS